jgi:ammonium transporter, Amt family
MKKFTTWRKALGIIGISLVVIGLLGYKIAKAQDTASPTPSTTTVTPAAPSSPAPATVAPTTPGPVTTVPTPAPAAAPTSEAEPSGDPSGNNTGTITDVPAEEAGKPTLEEVGAQVGKNKIGINFVWMLVAGFLVMFMQAGFALVEVGFTRAKNAAETMTMNFAIYGIGVIGYFLVGFGLMFGGVGALGALGGTAPLVGHEFALTIAGKSFGLFGTHGFGLGGNAYDVGVIALFLFQMVFMDTTATIPTGALAERWKFSAFVIWGFFVSMFLYPIYGNWVWGGGWLATLGANFGLGHGVVDFAGSSVVHAVGGVASIAGAAVLGARIGKFRKDGTPVAIPGHNIPMAILGTFILAFGWFGFNPGSTLAGTDLRISVVAVNTMIASATGMFAAMLYMWKKTGKPDPSMSANGMLAGLVAITAPCAFVNPTSAAIIGLIAGVLVIWAATFVERHLKLDDPVGAIAVHGANGLFGLIAVGIFADGTYGEGWNGVAGGVKGLLYGDASQFLVQVIGAAVCFIFVFVASWLFFVICKKTIGIRVSPEAELAGLDIPEVGVLAYPRDDMIGSLFIAPVSRGNDKDKATA